MKKIGSFYMESTTFFFVFNNLKCFAYGFKIKEERVTLLHTLTSYNLRTGSENYIVVWIFAIT